MSRLTTLSSRPLNSLLVLVVAVSSAATASAEVREFPYQATVRADDVEVRSGPGQRYYVTSRLKQGETVTVRRHDPGGWYMIDPPQGSFSWIEASLVRDNGDGTGMVRVARLPDGSAPRAIVRIGSQFSDDHAFYGRELADGDTVQIHGQKTVATVQGPVNMFQIAPPALEYRWVKGDFIVPVDAALRAQVDADPYAIPSGAMLSDTTAEDDFEEAAELTPAIPTERTTAAEIVQVANLVEEPDPFALPTPSAIAGTVGPPSGSASSGPALSAPPISTIGRPRRGADDKSKIAALDAHYLKLGQLTPDAWDLDNLIAGYEEVRRTGSPIVAAQAQQRLAALQPQRVIWNEYREFQAITSVVANRDAELVAIQQQLQGATNPGTMALLTPEEHFLNLQMQSSPGGAFEQQAGQPAIEFAGASTAGPATTGPILGPTPTANAAGGALPSAQTGPQQFSGAGIVQQMPAGEGRVYLVLATSEGRVLAVLNDVNGVGLEQYLGKSIGVMGDRRFDPRVQTDLISVKQAMPVQLAR
ncbi:MAG: SH3 domain-containing protein [Planctomycetaceae bacterium]